MQVIWAQEENPPTEVEPINWLLLTTLAIASVADVVQYLRWYSYRWLIERYHYVLKSGCRVEQLQLESAARRAASLSYLCDCRLALVMDHLPSPCFP